MRIASADGKRAKRVKHGWANFGRTPSRRFRLIVALSTLLLLHCAQNTKPADKPALSTALKLASDVWPPFTGAKGEPRVAIELVSRALSRAGVKSSVEMVDVGALTPGLKDRRFDGTSAIWKSPEREAYLIFSKPYLENRLVVVGRKGSDVAMDSLSALTGKRVAIVEAFDYGSAIEEAKAPIFVPGSSDQGNLQRLLAGEVDYVLVDDLLAHHLLTDYRAESNRLLAVGKTSLVVRPLHFALRRDVPNAEAIIARFDTEIDRMIADGSIHKILEVDWIQTDMDGDGRSELVLGGTKAGQSAPENSYEWLTARRPSGPTKRPRIWIEGQTYENWDDVPPRYKVEPEPFDPQRKGGIRFRFDLGL